MNEGLNRPKRALALKEADIEFACTRLLELDNWRALKTDPVSDRSREKGFGELGMADYLYIRYLSSSPGTQSCGWTPECAEVLWIEWKREGKKLQHHQTIWHRNERLRGALTLRAGVEFEASVDGFLAWYRKSGLMRRPI